MPVRSIAVPIFLSFLFTAGTVFAATVHVPGDQPTIQAGIEAAGDGDVVLVAPGTYMEDINFLGKAITVMGDGGADGTVIDGGRSDWVVRFDSREHEDSVLEGFTIRNEGEWGRHLL